jgi:hypothetical protein
MQWLCHDKRVISALHNSHTRQTARQARYFVTNTARFPPKIYQKSFQEENP